MINYLVTEPNGCTFEVKADCCSVDVNSIQFYRYFDVTATRKLSTGMWWWSKLVEEEYTYQTSSMVASVSLVNILKVEALP